MDILNWLYVKTAGLVRTKVNDPKTDLIALGANVGFNKRDDQYQTYAMTVEDFAGACGKFKYEIGQYVADEGGVIAHRWLSTTAEGSPSAGSFQNYLVVDTTDLSSNAIWASSIINIPNVESKWNGSENTANIVAAGVGSTAATLCNNSSNNGQTDWYQPAIDELVKIYNNRWEIEQGILTSGGVSLRDTFPANYWSSTEFNTGNAWSLSFTSGQTNYGDKGEPFNVRAVRKFSI